MWNNRAQIVWFALDTEDEKGIHLRYPIFCNVFRELLDSIHDLTVMLCFFVPERESPAPRISVHTGKELALLLMTLLESITESGPYDLVNVRSDHVNFRLSVKNNPAKRVTVQ